MNRFCIVLVALILVASAIAPAFSQDALSPYETRTQEDQTSWSLADLCARTAARLFPDYTPQGNAARENYRRACLRAHNLPSPNGQASVSK